MRRVVIAPRIAMLPLAAVTFFGLAADVIGVSLTLGAARIAAATHGSLTGFRIVGIAAAVAGLVLSVWCVREWRAVRAIDVAADGAWTLIGFFGVRGVLPATVDARLDLIGYVFVFVRPLPRVDPMVKGWVRSGARSWRLCRQDASTYDRVLRELGLAERAPRKAAASYERRVA